MSNNKQSSVEWLFDNLNLCFDKFDNGEYSYTEFVNASNEIQEQAKRMNRQEIIDAYHINPSEAKWQNRGFEFYNETYGGNNEQR